MDYTGVKAVVRKKILASFVILLLSVIALTAEESKPTLEQRYERIRRISTRFGSGGLAVLDAAKSAVEGKQLVQLEDRWATALKEGRPLFGSERLWKATGPGRTKDMLGQTTIGPWQITVANAREYGKPYGADPGWRDAQVIRWLESQPDLQARIAADFIDESYKKLGFRTPMAIQRYFWLDGFLQKKIGQGAWYRSVLAPPEGMQQTGFYAKQLLLGSRFNPDGLLYWLYVTGDLREVRRTLQTWSESGYPISVQDLSHCSCDPRFREFLVSTQLLR